MRIFVLLASLHLKTCRPCLKGSRTISFCNSASFDVLDAMPNPVSVVGSGPSLGVGCRSRSLPYWRMQAPVPPLVLGRWPRSLHRCRVIVHHCRPRFLPWCWVVGLGPFPGGGSQAAVPPLVVGPRPWLLALVLPPVSGHSLPLQAPVPPLVAVIGCGPSHCVGSQAPVPPLVAVLGPGPSPGGGRPKSFIQPPECFLFLKFSSWSCPLLSLFFLVIFKVLKIFASGLLIRDLLMILLVHMF